MVVVLVLAWLLSAEMMTSREQRDQIQKLTISLADKSKQENLVLQEKCALQVEKVFRQLGYKVGGMDLYQSHYNAKLNKCFMSLESTSFATGGMFVNKFLFDAYEQREYGQYMWMADKVKKFWEVPPITCELTPSLADKSLCNSEDEYKAFVARYME